jgi:hypothetical protein
VDGNQACYAEIERPMKVAVCIRGHIRDGLFTSDVLQYLNLLIKDGHEIDLFLHTWKDSEAKSSYRDLDQSHTFKVTKNLLYSYFKNYNIQKIIIDDDSKVELYGKLDGLVSASKCPLIAWKRMWAGKYLNIKSVIDSTKIYDLIISTRFDIFSNPVARTPQSYLLRLINQVDGNLFFKYPKYSKSIIGVDNFYCGKLKNMYTLISDFHFNLDCITTTYSSVVHQEELVYRYALDNNLV